MAMNDLVSDMLSRIRNAVRGNKRTVRVIGNRTCIGVAEVLKKAGYVEDFVATRVGTQPVLELTLRYGRFGEKLINELVRMSKPGRRVYVGVDQIPKVRSGMGVCILSTPKGVLAGHEAARLKMGGELICTVS